MTIKNDVKNISEAELIARALVKLNVSDWKPNHTMVAICIEQLTRIFYKLDLSSRDLWWETVNKSITFSGEMKDYFALVKNSRKKSRITKKNDKAKRD